MKQKRKKVRRANKDNDESAAQQDGSNPLDESIYSYYTEKTDLNESGNPTGSAAAGSTTAQEEVKLEIIGTGLSASSGAPNGGKVTLMNQNIASAAGGVVNSARDDVQIYADLEQCGQDQIVLSHPTNNRMSVSPKPPQTRQSMNSGSPPARPAGGSVSNNDNNNSNLTRTTVQNAAQKRSNVRPSTPRSNDDNQPDANDDIQPDVRSDDGNQQQMLVKKQRLDTPTSTPKKQENELVTGTTTTVFGS